MKKLFLTISMALLGVFVLNAYGTNVAVLDLAKVLQNDPTVAKVQKQLRDKFNPQGTQLIKARDQLRVDVVKFRQTPVLNVAMRKKLADRVLTEQKQLREDQVKFQRALLAAQNENLQSILKRIKGVVQTIAQREKYDLVITQANAAYNTPQIDITDKVIKVLKTS